MAKGQVTEDDLEKSIKSLGGLSGISSSGARRDSPFGSSFARKTEPASEKVVDLPAETVEELPKAVNLLVKEKTPEPVSKITESPKKVIQAVKKAPPVKEEVQKVVNELDARKADVLTERITLQMSPEMRDQLNDLARQLQRKKTDKAERITANTLMRAAIQLMLESLEVGAGDRPNNEQEVLEMLKLRIK